MSEKQIHIIGCGYIGKKIANLLKDDKNLKAAKLSKNRADITYLPLCFVQSNNSAMACEKLNLQCCQFNLDKSSLGITDEIKEGFENSIIMYLVAPPTQGKIDTRMAHFVSMLGELSVTPKKIVLISTTGVYGDCNGEWINEDEPVKPQADRAFRRLNAELQLQNYCQSEQLPLIIFRVPGIYAADKLPLKRISSGEPIVIADDAGYTNRIHADDLAAFCVEALISNVTPGIYNCCDGHPSTMHDYFTKVADAVGVPRPAEISLQQARQQLSAGMLSYLDESKRISNQKLLENFHTQFQYPDLEAGLQDIKKDELEIIKNEMI